MPITETKQTFKCSICGEKYRTLEDASECEGSPVQVLFDVGTEVVEVGNEGFETHVHKVRITSSDRKHVVEYFLGVDGDFHEKWRTGNRLKKLDTSLRQTVIDLNAKYGVKASRMQSGCAPVWHLASGVEQRAGVVLKRSTGGISFEICNEISLEQAERFLQLAAEMGLIPGPAPTCPHPAWSAQADGVHSRCVACGAPFTESR